MSFRAERWALVVLLAMAPQAPVRAQDAASTDRPSEAAISQALAKVRADPNISGERSMRMLRWKDQRAHSSATPSWFAWFGWVRDLFLWVDQSARVLLWLGLVALIGMFALYVKRTLERRGAGASTQIFTAPTHVRDLDIRPESLPSDIGRAARSLWDRDEHRAALALLYRGMLSRLAHVHSVPIRDSSTEGDCLALSTAHVTVPTRDYITRLVGVWLGYVYGGESTETAVVHGLCDTFAGALDRSGRAATARGSVA